MKKIITDIRTLAALFMASATFAACSSDDNITGEQPTGQVYTMTVNAVKGGDAAATRALNLDGTTLNRLWATSENIYVKKGNSWATGSLQPQTDGATATLKGKLSDIDIKADDELTLQTPKQGDISYDGQKGTLDDIAKNFDYATATVTVESVTGDGNITATDANFENQQAIVKFTLVDKADGTTPLNATQLSVNDGPNTFIATPDAATSEIYIAIPGISDKTITLNATVGSDFYSYEKTGVTFEKGKYYDITVNMTKQAVTDLSMVKCDGTARDEGKAWTANCYMVHTAGDYKLPLVYGNAIKNGETNADAYTGVSGQLEKFLRHDGEAITAPWIKDNGITVATAELLWQDSQELITAVGINGDYLTLTVGKDATEQEGNAVVAVKTSDGTIVWSWHIWVTKQDFASLTSINTDSYTYQVTPVNLGWVGDPVSTGYALYYQWGRKDAFKGTGDPTDTNVYDISGNAVAGFAYEASMTATIADNIKNPTKFYYNSDTSSPTNTQYSNMWDAQNTSLNYSTTATKKTVYDPCPPGFCVPTGYLYWYAVEQGGSTWDDTNKGRTWSGIFFPSSGERDCVSGTLNAVGSNGDYWSASPSGIVDGYGLTFTPDSWLRSSDMRADGISVRAVAEE